VLVVVIAIGALLGIVQKRCDTITRPVTVLRTMVRVNHNAVRLAGQRNGYVAGDVINLGIGDVTSIGVGIAALSRGVGGLAVVLVVARILLAFSWQPCAMVLVGTVALLRLNDYFLRAFSSAQCVVREAMLKLTAIALDVTSGIRVIKSLGGRVFRVQLLRHNRFGANDDFLLVGGDSLLMLDLWTALEKEFAITLDFADMTARSTVAELSALCRTSQARKVTI
jgi:acyl carrier protein